MARRFKRSYPETVMRIEFRRTGVYAAGGDAGGEPHLVAGEKPRAAARRRHKASRRDRGLLRRGGRDDGDRSERAAAWTSSAPRGRACKSANRSRSSGRCGEIHVLRNTAQGW